MDTQAIKAQARTRYVRTRTLRTHAHATYTHAVVHALCTHKFSRTPTHTDTQAIQIQVLVIYLFIYYTGYTNLGAAYPGVKNNPIPGREEEGEQGSQAGPAVQVSPSPPTRASSLPVPSPSLALPHSFTAPLALREQWHDALPYVPDTRFAVSTNDVSSTNTASSYPLIFL
jgi:hypothetical protein